MADELSDEAKAEIAEAIKIIRSDYSEGMFRKWLGEPKKEEPNDPNLPPKKELEPPKKKKGLWWGDSLEPEEPPKTPPEGGTSG